MQLYRHATGYRTDLTEERIVTALTAGVDYALSTQNPDGGLGGTPGNARSNSVPSDTAELLYGVLMALKHTGQRDRYESNIERCLNWLEGRAAKFPEGTGLTSTKSLIWTGLALTEAGRTRSKVIRHLLAELNKLRVRGQGWRNNPQGPSQVFNTSLSLLLLSKLSVSTSRSVDQARRWLILSRNRDGGWGWFRGYQSNALCTSTSLVALRSLDPRRKIAEKSLSFLLATQQSRKGITGGWLPVPEFDQSTTVTASSYFHFTTPYALSALIKLSKSSSEPVQKGVEYILALQRRDGGWPFYDGFYWFDCPMSSLPWATGNALWALSSYLDSK
jgi:prenyltransferase beta subunit